MSDTITLNEGDIFGLGNPLLDLIAEVDQNFLEKYGLKADDAILYEDKHKGLESDMLEKYSVKYVAGGAVQNTMRVTEWLLGFKPNICTYMGCIGEDEFGQRMQQEAVKDKINCIYRIDENEKTGYCCVLVNDNGKQRSLVAYLGAANHMKKEHLMKNWSYVEKAKILYVSGFHLTVCVPAIMEIAKHVADSNEKQFCFNLSAPFICDFFKNDLLAVLPYVDILFGNKAEATALALVSGWKATEISEIALLIAKEKKVNSQKPRLVVITRSADSIIVASSDSDSVTFYPVDKLEPHQIVDTNGAGDAFVAGFISQYIFKASLGQCIKVGSYAAQQIIQCEGAQYPSHPANIFDGKAGHDDKIQALLFKERLNLVVLKSLNCSLHLMSIGLLFSRAAGQTANMSRLNGLNRNAAEALLAVSVSHSIKSMNSFASALQASKTRIKSSAMTAVITYDIPEFESNFSCEFKTAYEALTDYKLTNKDIALFHFGPSDSISHSNIITGRLLTKMCAARIAENTSWVTTDSIKSSLESGIFLYLSAVIGFNPIISSRSNTDDATKIMVCQAYAVFPGLQGVVYTNPPLALGICCYILHHTLEANTGGFFKSVKTSDIMMHLVKHMPLKREFKSLRFNKDTKTVTIHRAGLNERYRSWMDTVTSTMMMKVAEGKTFIQLVRENDKIVTNASAIYRKLIIVSPAGKVRRVSLSSEVEALLNSLDWD